MIEKDLEWFNANYENPDNIEFESFNYFKGDLNLLGKEIESYQAYIIEGNLTLKGKLHLEYDLGLYVTGTITCDNFHIEGDIYIECNKLIVKKYANFINIPEEYGEISILEATILSCDKDNEILEDINISAEYIIEDEIEDKKFNSVYNKLKDKTARNNWLKNHQTTETKLYKEEIEFINKHTKNYNKENSGTGKIRKKNNNI